MKKSLLSLALVFCIVLTLLPVSAFALDVAADGTYSSNLVEIYTVEDLCEIEKNLSGNYILMNDIQISAEDYEENGVLYNDGLGWQPIGLTEENPFSGTFDGNGKKISGLKFEIKYDNETECNKYSSLFGYTSGEIKNLYLEGIDSSIQYSLISTSYTSWDNGFSGGTIAFQNAGTISNCKTSGKIRTIEKLYDIDDVYAGGICVYNSGTIFNCSNGCNISIEFVNGFGGGTACIGGIAAVNLGSIIKCENVASWLIGRYGKIGQEVGGWVYVGGISGQNEGNISESKNAAQLIATSEATPYTKGSLASCGGISAECTYQAKTLNCFNSGIVYSALSKNNYCGGICGIQRNNSYSSMGICNYCCSVGDVLYESSPYHSNNYLGGIIGCVSYPRNAVYKPDPADYCYYLADGVTGGNDYGEKVSKNRLGNKLYFYGLDFDSIWTINNVLGFDCVALQNCGITNCTFGHSYGAWTQTKAATCTEKGEQQRNCARCGTVEAKEIPQKSHTYWNGICLNCGDVDFEQHEHVYTEGKKTEATCTTDGYMVYNCACGDSYTAIMDHAYGHHFSGACCEWCGAVNPDFVEEPQPTISIKTDNGKPMLKWAAVDSAEKYEVYRATSKTGTYTKMYTTSSTSYTNTSAVPGTTYYYKVRAIAANGGESDFSVIKSITCDCAQPVVTISTVASSGKVKLSWSAVDGASKYEIWRATSSTGTYTKYYTTTNTSYTNSSAVAGYTYYYKVKAICGKSSYGDSAFSAVKSITCDCAQPVATITTVASSGKPTLKWSAVDGATKYEIWRATSKDGTYTKMYTTSSTSYTNSSAVAGKTYYYKVKALCDKSSYGDSAFSAVKSITCDCARPVVSITTSSGHPKLSWKAVDGATKYEVYRATSSNGTYTKMYTTSSTSYTNTSAKAGTTYYYKVVAVCGASSYGNSAYSTVVSIKAK